LSCFIDIATLAKNEVCCEFVLVVLWIHNFWSLKFYQQATLAFACAFIALACADTLPIDYEAQIEQTDFTVNQENGYKFGYKTTNNIKIAEEGDGQKVVEGSYSYVDPDGRTHVSISSLESARKNL
jgi:Insect cuticle protein